MLDFGAFVEIEKGVEGLIHVSEFSEERVEDPKTFVKPGQTLKAEIIGVDTAERKIGLSFRGATRAEELADAQGFSGGVPTRDAGRRHARQAGGADRQDRRGDRREGGGAGRGQEGEGRRGRRPTTTGERRVVATDASVAGGAVMDRGVPMTTTSASRTLAWLRQFAKLWGFALFCVLVVYIFREVALPFLFAILVAYILAPLVARLASCSIGARAVPALGRRSSSSTSTSSAVLGLFIGYFVPKLSGDFARLFREAPALFAKVNKDWLPRAGAWIDTHFAPEEVDAGRRASTPTPRSPQAPRAILVEPLPDGRYRIDLDARDPRGASRSTNGRYLIAPPAAEESSTAAARASGSARSSSGSPTRLKSTEGESRRVLEYGQKFIGGVVFGIGRLFLVLMVAAFILIDLERIQGFLRSLVPERYQGDYDRIYVGIDRGLSGVIRGQLRHLPDQRHADLHRAVALQGQVPAAARRASRRR